MSENKQELIQKVENIIDQIRPYLQQDGGDIKFVEITDDNVVAGKIMKVYIIRKKGKLVASPGKLPEENIIP